MSVPPTLDPQVRSFFARLLAFGTLQALIFAWVWWSCPRIEDHYATASIDKHALLRSTPGRRVILVGGSNVAFGYHSELFSDYGLEPVNMGLNVGLGISFFVREVEDNVRKGDVVIISPEYSLFWVPFSRDELWSLLERRPRSTCLLGPEHVKGALDHGLIYFTRKLKCAVHGLTTDHEFARLYRRSAFNKSGDFVAHYGRKTSFDVAVLEVDDAEEHTDFTVGLEGIERLSRRCKEVGATCYLSYPPLRPMAMDGGRQTIGALDRALKSETTITVLGSPEDMVLPNTSFFDSGYHLNEAGSLERTRRVLRLLEAEGFGKTPPG